MRPERDEIALLGGELALARRQAYDAREQSSAYRWGLGLILSHVLDERPSDLRIAKFAKAVIDSADSDPAFIALLREPRE